MKKDITELVQQSLKKLPYLSKAPLNLSVESTVERTRNSEHGDFACNIVMQISKLVNKKPREVADDIVKNIYKNNKILRIEIAGPGFINFYLSPQALEEELDLILEEGAKYGSQKKRKSQKILLEFISANPTGPLHVGHGRHAAYGASVGNLLEAAGYQVHREYYINDAGRQIDILGVSTWIRWLQSIDINVAFPVGGYRGDYIKNVIKDIDAKHFKIPTLKNILDDLPNDAPKGDADTYIDALIEKAKTILGFHNFDQICNHALNVIREDIKDDLEEFGVSFDNWFSEKSLEKAGKVDDAINILRKRGMLYEKDGATWFSSTK